jgi:hypothetical protein
MKLINLEQKQDGAVRLELTREELHTFRNALYVAIDDLDAEEAKREGLIELLAGATEEDVRATLAEEGLDDESMAENPLEELKDGLDRTKRILPKVRALSSALEDIVSEHDLARYL